jgi:hypothetical protein
MADENKKPDNMLEALEGASERTENTLVKAFRECRETRPEMSIGSSVRIFHFSLIHSLQKNDAADVFSPVLGFLAKCLLPHLTAEEKEALRNDKLSGLL